MCLPLNIIVVWLHLDAQNLVQQRMYLVNCSFAFFVLLYIECSKKIWCLRFWMSYPYRDLFVYLNWIVLILNILHKYFSSSVGAASDCVFLAPPMQQGQREGSVSPGTEKRNRSISVIAGLCYITSEIFWLNSK